MKHTATIMEKGQMGWKRSIKLSTNADSIGEAKAKFEGWINKKNGHSQYTYTLLKVSNS